MQEKVYNLTLKQVHEIIESVVCCCYGDKYDQVEGLVEKADKETKGE